MSKALGLAVGLVLLAQAAIADDRAKVVGVWRLLSFDLEFQDGSPSRPQYGTHPFGYIIFTPHGRMMTVIEGEGRKPAKTDEERATLFRTMFAYSGMYRLEADKWITQVDVSWNPVWRGTEQVRFYVLDGDRLKVTAAWGASANLPGNPMTRGVLIWERVKQ